MFGFFAKKAAEKATDYVYNSIKQRLKKRTELLVNAAITVLDDPALPQKKKFVKGKEAKTKQHLIIDVIALQPEPPIECPPDDKPAPKPKPPRKKKPHRRRPMGQ